MVERICKLIKEKGMSISSVEKTLGFGNGAIKRFEKNSPSIDKIIKLSNFLNVSLEYLVLGTESTSKVNRIEMPKTQLTQNEEEMLSVFRMLSEREQLKEIGRLEKTIEQENVG